MTTLNTIAHFSPIYNVNASFDGQNDFIICPATAAFPYDQLSFECWVKISATQPGSLAVYALDQGGSQINLLALLDVTNLNITVNMASTGPTGLALNDGNWHYFAMTWSGSDGSLLLYLDGQLKKSLTIGQGTFLEPGHTFLLGQEDLPALGAYPVPNPVALQGELAEVRLWNKARSSYFIQLFMSRTLPGSMNYPSWQAVISPTIKVGNVVQRAVFTSIGAGAENAVFATDSQKRIWFSSDFGQTWTQPSPASALVQVSAAPKAQPQPGVPTPVAAMGVDQWQYVWLSSDFGKTWNKPSATMQLAMVSVWADVQMGVNISNVAYYSTTFGTSWVQAGTIPMSWIAVDAQAGWAVATDGQLYKSELRNGTDWTKIQQAKPLAKIWSSPGILLAQRPDNTLHTSEDGGVTWTPFDDRGRPFAYGDLMGNVAWCADTNGYAFFAEAATQLSGNWMLDEGYGNVAYDSSGHDNSAVLGDARDETQPMWKVTTILEPPGFVYDAVAIRELQFAQGLAQPEPRPISVALTEEMTPSRTKLKAAATKTAATKTSAPKTTIAPKKKTKRAQKKNKRS